MQALLRYAESTGLALDQLGYQAIASSCRREEEGLQLLEEMKVRLGIMNLNVKTQLLIINCCLFYL